MNANTFRHRGFSPSPQPSPLKGEGAAAGARRAGFTLIELMVAVAITSVIILAINQVFSSVSTGVSSGLALSEIMASSRIVGDQIERDFKEMIGPGEDGVLVIINQQQTGMHVIPDDVETSTTRNVRTDQLMFVRRRSGAEPMSPSGTGGYAGTTKAAYARVWYGHGLRANEDGTRPTGTGLGVFPNQFAAQWILARNNMFLDSDGASGAAHANGGWETAPIVGYGTGADAPPASTRFLHGGTVDVANYGLVKPSTHGAMVGSSEQSGDDNANKRLYQELNSTDYATRSFEYLFLTNRLLVNPEPAGTTWESWRIAQMHPYLAGQVSDFIVEFAGDYAGPAGIDTETNGAIRWYGLGNLPAGFDAGGQSPIRTVAPPGGGTAFVFRHGGGNTNWPMLIRIRYRLHDSKNRVVGADGELGRWFEIIVPVIRQ